MSSESENDKAVWVIWFCVRVSAFFSAYARMRSTNLPSASDGQIEDGLPMMSMHGAKSKGGAIT